MTNKLKIGVVLSLTLVASALAFKQKNTPTPTPVVQTTFDPIELLKSSDKQYPALIQLLIHTDGGTGSCSAAVIKDNIALTASHCVAHANMFGEMEVHKISVISLLNVDNKNIKVKASVVGFNPRADYAVITGDFRKFKKLKYNDSPAADILFNKYNLIACGFPYGVYVPACYPFSNPQKAFDVIKGKGQLYAGMSGGPVIDLATGTIYAVNSAVMDGFVVIAPIVNILGGK
jgi:S1-C subfamily serine protease